MSSPLYQEVSVGVHRAFRTLIPEPQNREPVTWITFLYAVIAFVPFTFLAYLARRPNTYLIRLLILPTVIMSILKVAFGYAWMVPELNVYNWGQCLLAEVVVGRAIEFAFTKEGMLKIGEARPGEPRKDKYVANGHTVSQKANTALPVPSWLRDSLELMHTMRGLQWKFSRGVHIPRQMKPLQRISFLRATLISFTKNFLILDLLETTIKLFPGVGTPAGGSMFYTDLPPLQRYIVSTVIHILSGTCLLAGFQMVYDIITLIAVGLFDGSPLAWPPVMDNPWISDSMHNFWSKRWHQLLRQTFLVFGGYPGMWIAGNLGMLIGVFLASGLFHECAIYAMGRGFDSTTIVFFTMQAFLLLGERFWRRWAGHRVGGWYGQVWVYFILFITAQPMVDSWHRRGLGGGMVIPPFVSPTKILLRSLGSC